MNILLIQLRRIGDILLASSIFPLIKEADPEGTIDFLCEPMGQSILHNNPLLQKVHLYNKKEPIKEILRVRDQSYDAVVDLMGNPRTAYVTGLSQAPFRVGFKHRGRGVFYNFQVPIPKEPEYSGRRKYRLIEALFQNQNIKIPSPKNIRPHIHLSNDDTHFADEWIQREGLGGKDFVVLAPAHRHSIRQWIPENFKQVALDLNQKKGIPVYLAYGPGEESILERIRVGVENKVHLMPQTSLRQMAAIFQKAKVVVSNDSGAMHLAVAVGTPTVTVYGPTRPIDWNPSLTIPKPDSTQDIPVTSKKVACLGCHLDFCPHKHECMTHCDPDEVTKATMQLLSL